MKIPKGYSFYVHRWRTHPKTGEPMTMVMRDEMFRKIPPYIGPHPETGQNVHMPNGGWVKGHPEGHVEPEVVREMKEMEAPKEPDPQADDLSFGPIVATATNEKPAPIKRRRRTRKT